jgi:hypothetical protein
MRGDEALNDKNSLYVGRSIGGLPCVSMGKSPHDMVVIPFRSTCLLADRGYIDGGKVLTCGKVAAGSFIRKKGANLVKKRYMLLHTILSIYYK